MRDRLERCNLVKYFDIITNDHGKSFTVLDWCLEVSEFELQSRYYLHFGRVLLGQVWTLLYLSYGVNSIIAVLLQELDNSKEVDMLLNKEIKTEGFYFYLYHYDEYNCLFEIARANNRNRLNKNIMEGAHVM